MTLAVQPGRVLGYRYSLTARIASGGMGDVWEARDGILDREVAVKILRTAGGAADEGFTERFRDEAKHAAALTHPNVAAVYDYGEDEDGTAYLVMELVPGEPLSEIIRLSHRMDPEQVRWIIGQSALALAAAHAAGVVHRDVKPGNIMVTPDGTAKLTDFGIARAGDGNGHTMTGEVLGTPDYISPEQALGEQATHLSDLYSLGVVAHEMLTGTKPFDMGTPVATALAQVNDSPPPLPETVPADLRAVVEGCLAKSADDRPADAREVALALGMTVDSAAPAVAVGAATTRMPTLASETPHWRTRAEVAAATRHLDIQSRRRVWLAAPVALLVVLAAFGIGKLFGSDPSQAQPPVVVTNSVTTEPTEGGSPTTSTTMQQSTSAPAPAAPGKAPKGKPADAGKGKGPK